MARHQRLPSDGDGISQIDYFSPPVPTPITSTSQQTRAELERKYEPSFWQRLCCMSAQSLAEQDLAQRKRNQHELHEKFADEFARSPPVTRKAPPSYKSGHQQLRNRSTKHKLERDRIDTTADLAPPRRLIADRMPTPLEFTHNRDLHLAQPRSCSPAISALTPAGDDRAF